MKSKIPPKMMKKVLKNKKSKLGGSLKKITPAKEQRIVAADNLNWKPVEVPDTMDDFGGFYGLEEIEGVDVKVINGKVQFITKEDKPVDKSTDEETKEEDVEMQDDESTPVSKAKATEPKVKETKAQKAKRQEQMKTEKKLEKKKEQEKDLKTNNFEGLLELPDEVDLPEWSENNLSLSSYTLQGLQKLSFTSPTPIQKRTIPLAMQGKDIVGKAITGSGKTFAYGIPILERYLAKYAARGQAKADKKKPPTGIIFAPTRELAHQVVKHLEQLARYSPLTVNGIVCITGGLSIQKQERLLSFGPGVVVATPGRMLEILEKDSKLAERLASTEMLVLDEADRLLQDGHFEEMEKIIELFKKVRPTNLEHAKWQTLVFSATFSKDLFGKLDKTGRKGKHAKETVDKGTDAEIIQLLSSKLKFKDQNPTFIDANPKEIVTGKVTEALIECGAMERDLHLYYFLLMYPGATLIFANSIDSVKRLAPFLNNLKIPSFSIHSQMIQKQRLRNLERFTKATETNSTAVLIASDVAARGLDIPNITHVVHYHLPRSADVYVHRSGRTGRAGKEGVSVMICSPQEASGPFRKLRSLVSAESGSRFDKHADVKMLPVEVDLMPQLRERVKLAQELADTSMTPGGTGKEASWVIKAAEDLGIDDLSDMDEDDYLKRSRKRKEKKALTKQDQQTKRSDLEMLLKTPIRKDKRRSYLTGGLNNLADLLLNQDRHSHVIGQTKVNALDVLKQSTKKKAKK